MLGIRSWVPRAASGGRRRILAGGQVTRGAGGHGDLVFRALHPLPFCFRVFQGAILTTMLATRNFSGRCRLRAPLLALCQHPGQARGCRGEVALPPALGGAVGAAGCSVGWGEVVRPGPGHPAPMGWLLGWQRVRSPSEAPQRFRIWAWCVPTQIACALVVMWVLGVARDGGSCFCALLEMFVVQGKSLRHSVLCTGRALDTSPGATAAAGSLLSLLLCPPDSGRHRSHRDSHSPCIPHPPGCTETQGQGQRVVAQPVHQERPWHSTACQRGGLGISFWGSLAEVPRSWVSGWAGGDGGSPGGDGEVPGRGWHPHLSRGDRADRFSTCGQRVRGRRSPAAGGDPVTGGAKHQRAGNSKTFLQTLPSRTARGLPVPTTHPSRVTAPGVGLLPPVGALGCPAQPRGWGPGHGRQPEVGSGEGVCFSSLSKCGLQLSGRQAGST